MDSSLEGFMIEIQLISQKYGKELNKIWKSTFDQNTYSENFAKVVEMTKDFYEELLDQSIETNEDLKKEIDNLRNEAENLKILLNVDVELNTDKSLSEMQSELHGCVAELRECLRQQQEQIYELLLEQKLLVDELGEPPRPLLADPLPTPEEIERFRQHLQQLKDERVQRMHELSSLRREIKNYLQVLELQVTSETEDRLLNHRQIKLNKETFTELRHMHKCYGEQVKKMRQEIDDMRENLKQYSECLDTREMFRRYKEYTQTTLNFYNSELQRCLALKGENMKLVIDKIREEIVEWWNKTLKSELERCGFVHFNSDCYTDDLLRTHKAELENLKQYHENNEEIFKLFADRKILWERINALEAKVSEPGRYNNRGGQLLKEEKERKLISNKLPRIEQQITDLVKQYEEREHTHFLVYGENILDVMANDWGKKPQDKEKLSSARKQALTPLSKLHGTTTQTKKSVRNVTTFSLRKTPLTAGISGKHQYSTTTSQERKLNPTEKTDPVAKRGLMFAVNSPNVFLKPTYTAVRTSYKSPLKNSRIAVSSARRRSLRRSSKTSKKQCSKTTNNAAATTTAASIPSSDDTYDSFLKCIEPASRSSIKPHSISSNPTLPSKRLLPLASVENLYPRKQAHPTLRITTHQ